MILNPEQWERSVKRITGLAEKGLLPKGLKGLLFLPGMDGHRADCVWEADSIESLKTFLDRESGSGAKNEYFQVDDTSAFGLPVHGELHHTV